MAEYINIRGQSIEVVASDPANPTIGQIWYNSTSNTLKGQAFQPTGWSSGNNMNTARNVLAGAGTQTAALGAGGEAPGGNTGATEEYDGTSWTNSNPLNTARGYLAAAGIQTAAVVFGGYTPPPDSSATEKYDGTSWTNTASLATQRTNMAGAGTQAAGLAAGGDGDITGTEEFIGASAIAKTFTTD